jgi:hypothetical protein
MTIPELQAAIIASSNPSQALTVFYKFCGSFGINSNAPPEWWTKISELTEEKKQLSVPFKWHSDAVTHRKRREHNALSRRQQRFESPWGRQ